MKARFQFVNYKIDAFEFILRPDISLLKSESAFRDKWTYQFHFRKPTFFKSQNEYVVGIMLSMRLTVKDENEEDLDLIRADCGISGVFAFENEEGSDGQLQRFLKINAPTTLMPYLRSFLTNVFSTGGFGPVRIPLFNMVAVAENSFGEKDLEIETVD